MARRFNGGIARRRVLKGAAGIAGAALGSGAVTQLGGTFLLVKTGSTTFDLVRVG